MSILHHFFVIIMYFFLSHSDEGSLLHAEEGAEAGAPLSLDSALQEQLQQERASLQSQLELLEKKKNEEIQNVKTSLIAEQQVCVWAVNRHLCDA